jgi:hypothetical protein
LADKKRCPEIFISGHTKPKPKTTYSPDKHPILFIYPFSLFYKIVKNRGFGISHKPFSLDYVSSDSGAGVVVPGVPPGAYSTIMSESRKM